MATSPFFSGRIPQKLFDAVEKQRLHTGESKTDILIKALSAYVNIPVEERQESEAENTEKIKLLEMRIEAIELLIAGQLNSAHTQSSSTTSPSSEAVDSQMSIYDVQPPESVEGTEATNTIPEALENKTDNDIDNNIQTDTLEVVIPQEENVDSLPEGEWEYLGEMGSLDILKLEELQTMDAKKLKNKVANTNTSNKKKEALVEPIFWRIDRQELGARGKLIFKVYRRRP